MKEMIIHTQACGGRMVAVVGMGGSLAYLLFVIKMLT